MANDEDKPRSSLFDGPVQVIAEPPPDLSREEAIRFLNGGAQAEVEIAFRDGALIDYEKRVVGPGNRDLEIRIVLRHKSVLPPETT